MVWAHGEERRKLQVGGPKIKGSPIRTEKELRHKTERAKNYKITATPNKIGKSWNRTHEGRKGFSK